MHAIAFGAIRTRWRIDTYGPLPSAVKMQVRDPIEGFDAVWSRFRRDSLVGRMAHAHVGGTFAFPEDGFDLFALYDRLHALIGGAVDPPVGGDLERLGYEADYSLRPFAPDLRGERPVWSRDVRRCGAAARC